MPGKYSARLRRRICLAMAAATLLGAASLLGSCSRKAQAARAAADAAAKPGQPASALAQRPAEDSHAQAPKPAVPLAASIRAFGVGAISVPRMPEDFSLGPLQSYSPAPGDEAAVFAVARAFMDGIAAGKLDKDLLLPEARDALSLLLAPDPAASTASKPEGGIASYRLGKMLIRGEDASLKVRLPSAGALSEPKAVRQEGLLSLRKEGDSWYIETLALAPPLTGALAFTLDPRVKAK